MHLFFPSPLWFAPSIRLCQKQFSFLWCFGDRCGLPRYRSNSDCHIVTGGRTEYASHLLPAEGRQSIQPLHCQKGDADILGERCSAPLPRFLLSQFVCKCMYVSFEPFISQKGARDLWVHELPRATSPEKGWVFPANSWEGRRGRYCCVCVCGGGWTAPIETLSSNTWRKSLRGGVCVCVCRQVGVFLRKSPWGWGICDWQLTLLITAPWGQTPDNSCCRCFEPEPWTIASGSTSSSPNMSKPEVSA